MLFVVFANSSEDVVQLIIINFFPGSFKDSSEFNYI